MDGAIAPAAEHLAVDAPQTLAETSSESRPSLEQECNLSLEDECIASAPEADGLNGVDAQDETDLMAQQSVASSGRIEPGDVIAPPIAWIERGDVVVDRLHAWADDKKAALSDARWRRQLQQDLEDEIAMQSRYNRKGSEIDLRLAAERLYSDAEKKRERLEALQQAWVRENHEEWQHFSPRCAAKSAHSIKDQASSSEDDAVEDGAKRTVLYGNSLEVWKEHTAHWSGRHHRHLKLYRRGMKAKLQAEKRREQVVAEEEEALRIQQVGSKQVKRCNSLPMDVSQRLYEEAQDRDSRRRLEELKTDWKEQLYATSMSVHRQWKRPTSPGNLSPDVDGDVFSRLYSEHQTRQQKLEDLRTRQEMVEAFARSHGGSSPSSPRASKGTASQPRLGKKLVTVSDDRGSMFATASTQLGEHQRSSSSPRASDASSRQLGSSSTTGRGSDRFDFLHKEAEVRRHRRQELQSASQLECLNDLRRASVHNTPRCQQRRPEEVDGIFHRMFQGVPANEELLASPRFEVTANSMPPTKLAGATRSEPVAIRSEPVAIRGGRMRMGNQIPGQSSASAALGATVEYDKPIPEMQHHVEALEKALHLHIAGQAIDADSREFLRAALPPSTQTAPSSPQPREHFIEDLGSQTDTELLASTMLIGCPVQDSAALNGFAAAFPAKGKLGRVQTKLIAAMSEGDSMSRQDVLRALGTESLDIEFEPFVSFVRDELKLGIADVSDKDVWKLFMALDTAGIGAVNVDTIMKFVSTQEASSAEEAPIQQEVPCAEQAFSALEEPGAHADAPGLEQEPCAHSGVPDMEQEGTNLKLHDLNLESEQEFHDNDPDQPKHAEPVLVLDAAGEPADEDDLESEQEFHDNDPDQPKHAEPVLVLDAAEEPADEDDVDDLESLPCSPSPSPSPAPDHRQASAPRSQGSSAPSSPLKSGSAFQFDFAMASAKLEHLKKSSHGVRGVGTTCKEKHRGDRRDSDASSKVSAGRRHSRASSKAGSDVRSQGGSRAASKAGSKVSGRKDNGLDSGLASPCSNVSLSPGPSQMLDGKGTVASDSTSKKTKTKTKTQARTASAPAGKLSRASTSVPGASGNSAARGSQKPSTPAKESATPKAVAVRKTKSRSSI